MGNSNNVPCISSNVDPGRPSKPSKKGIRRESAYSKNEQDLERIIAGNISYRDSRDSYSLLSGSNYIDALNENSGIEIEDRNFEGSYHSSQNEYG